MKVICAPFKKSEKEKCLPTHSKLVYVILKIKHNAENVTLDSVESKMPQWEDITKNVATVLHIDFPQRKCLPFCEKPDVEKTRKQEIEKRFRDKSLRIKQERLN